jgi:hypothetical protein
MRASHFLAVAILVGCANRPAWPERDGATALRNRGFGEDLVERVVEGQPLESGELEELGRIDDENVAFLLARNPSLPLDRVDHYSKSRNDFIRSGLARNPALPEDVVAVLMRDPSHTVWTGLAANPGLAAKTLMQLRELHDLEWSWFAMNPACPPEVEQAIRASGDADAIQWLERTRSERRGWPVEQPVLSSRR